MRTRIDNPGDSAIESTITTAAALSGFGPDLGFDPMERHLGLRGELG